MRNLQSQIKKQIQIELARRSFRHFVEYTKKDYYFNWHHDLLCKKLNDFGQGKIKRLMIFTPPRHGKSELVSRRLPAWIFGRDPKAKIISTSYSAELSSSFNRDVQRVIDSEEYKEIFDDVKLNDSNVRTSGNWLRNNDIFEIVNHGGSYRSAGVGGSITGMGGNFMLIDDPLKNYEEAKSPTIRKKVWEWYTSTFYTRQEKEAGILVIQCMTGDTMVLMEDGTQKQLKDIKIGDKLATFNNGKIDVSTVKNWKSQGIDRVFTIKTTSGIIVKANERHPFLILKDGELRWLRLKELKKNDKMIRVGASGLEKLAHLKGANYQQNAKDFVSLITTKTGGKGGLGHHQLTINQEEMRILSTDTESQLNNTKSFLNFKTKFAQFAKNHQFQKSTFQIAGEKNCASTIVTALEKLADFFATNVILLLSTVIQSKFCNRQLTTSDFIVDEILKIEESKPECVYDLEVEKTQNFIANGLVSHNTRWHEDDLAGMLLNEMKKGGEYADQWEVITLPAICELKRPYDPRNIGDALWPWKYDERFLNITKHTLGSFQFSALYQQNPTPDDGQFVKIGWIKHYDVMPARFEEMIQSWDMTFGSTNENASFVVGSVYGRNGANIYLVDQIRKQMDFVDTVESFKLMTRRYPQATCKLIEKKANGQAVIDTLKNEIVGIVPIEPDSSKESRFSSCQPLYEAGNVLYPNRTNCPWIDDHISEIVGFPNAKFNDRVDAESQALNYFRRSGIGNFTASMAQSRKGTIAASLGGSKEIW